MINRIMLFVALMALSPLIAGAAPGADTGPGARAPMVLIGVVPGTGQALIWKAASEEYVLIRVGERCQDYQLRRLLRDRAILTRGDASMVLTLDSTPLIGPGEQRRERGGLPASIHTAREARQSQVSPPMAEVQEQDPRPPVTGAAPGPASAEEMIPSPIMLGEGVQVISLLSLRKEVSSFMHGLSPYRVNVSASGGVQVSGITAGSLLHTLGLEDGDEIVSIGGVQVSSKEEALNAYLTFAPEREVELHLLRQGAPRTLSFRLSA